MAVVSQDRFYCGTSGITITLARLTKVVLILILARVLCIEPQNVLKNCENRPHLCPHWCSVCVGGPMGHYLLLGKKVHIYIFVIFVM